MPLVKRIRGRGSNLVVVANGELLFTAGGPVGSFTRTFSNRLRAFAAQEAPTNKRPRWGHYGKPLKSTMRASTEYDPLSFRVHSAVGSTAKHSVHVDQGTGIYNPEGGSAYEASVLPPWRRGSASLYESTWRPTPTGGRAAPVMIRGQKGQFFFDKALRRAFTAARLAEANLPVPNGAIESASHSLTDFLGNTEANAAFRASLEEWRSWRDAYFNAGGLLGENGGRRPRTRSPRSRPGYRPRKPSEAQVRKRQARASKRYRKRQRDAGAEARSRDKVLQKKQRASRTADRAKFLAAMTKKYGTVDTSSLDYQGGYWVILVQEKDSRGRNVWREKRAKAKS